MNNQYEQAAKDLTKAIDFGFSDPKVFMNRGLAYFYTKKIDKACKDWEKAAAMGAPEGKKAVDLYCKKK